MKLRSIILIFFSALLHFGSHAQLPTADTEYGIVVSPNPFQNSINLDLSENVEGESIKLVVSNILGKPIKTIFKVAQENQKIDLSDLPNGPYILSIYANDNRINSIRIFKE